MSEEKKPLQAVQTFVALLSAIVGVVAAIQAVSSKDAADDSARQAREFERQANDRAERDTRSKYDAVAYEAVVKVLEIDTGHVAPGVAEKRQRAVLALIASTASDSMKQTLFSVMGSGSGVTESVRKEADLAAEFFGRRAVRPRKSHRPRSRQRSPRQPRRGPTRRRASRSRYAAIASCSSGAWTAPCSRRKCNAEPRMR